MMPVIPGSINNVPLIPGTSFATGRKECLKRCTLLRNSTKETWSSQKYFLPLSTSLRLFPQFRCGFSLHPRPRAHILSATGTDVAMEEADSPVSGEDSAGTSEVPPDADGASEESSIKSATPARKRSRPGRKSEMPPIKPEELVPGATFTGKVKSIQPFGAFVDFGAFTDGLVHVSRLSDSFVKDVGNIVSVGQEVTVRLVEANMETGRISLTMRESDDISKLQQRTDAPASTDKAKTPRKGPPRSNQRRDEAKKTSKFVKGQDLEGTVKNMTRSGAFISLPEGEEGFLPQSEELDEGFGNIMGGSSLQVGQEVSVRVLRINRGQVTLTMKKEEDAGELDAKLSQGVVHTATNPFVLAFRKNKDIAAFLDKRETEEEPSKISVVPQISDGIEQKVSQIETKVEEVLDQETIRSESEKTEGKVIQTTELDVEEVLDKETGSSESEKIEGKGTQTTETELKEVLDTETSSSESEKIEGKVTQKTETEVEEVLDQETGRSDTEKIEGKGIQTTETEVEEVLDKETSSSESGEITGKVTQQTETEVEEVLDQETGGSETEKIEGKGIQTTETEVEEVLDKETSSSESGKIAGKATQKTETEVEEVLDQETSRSETEKIEGKGIQMTETGVEEVLDKETSSSESGKIEGKVNQKNETEVEEVLDQETSCSKTEKVEAKGIQTTETEVEEVLDRESSSSGTEKIEGKGTPTTETEVGQVLDQETGSSQSDKVEGKVTESGTQTDGIDGAIKDIKEEAETLSTSDWPTQQASVVDVVENKGESDLSSQDQVREESTHITNNESAENIISGSLESVETAAKTVEEKMEIISEIPSPEKVSSANEEVSTESGLGNNGKSDVYGEIVNPVTSGGSIEEVTGSQVDNAVVKDEARILAADASAETPVVEDEKEGITPEKDSSTSGSSEQLGVPTKQQTTSEDSQVSEVKNEMENTEVKDEANNEAPSADIEIPSAPLVEAEKVEENVTNSDGQHGVPSPKDTTTKATISPALVKQLREETGAGMMDCKKALSETGGDLVKAQEFLRKKGLASAEKKASRATAEGRIGSYIHDSRIGVLIEVNCETDFVSRGEIFKELVDDLAMQVAACPQVQYLVTEDVPKETVEKEREIKMQKEDLLSKPEQIRSKIVDGRIRKRLEELALLEQPYIKNDKMVVKDWVKQTIATIGENIKVKRFVRFNLGEGLEKKSQDFAAEVAAQTAAKAQPVPSPVKEQPPAAAEAKESVGKPPKAMVSAALVKQLREETGAGMMDCKKALSETGGDLEKAQEYLRKKGLSTADKKSSRLAAEGRIGSYIHDSRIGVLIEVNCETDFVGRSEKFKELVDDLAMQVVACPQVQYVSIEDIADSVVQKEKELEMQREDLQSKPESIRGKIVEGRVSKRLGELALLEQPFIKDDSVLVKDLVKQTVAAIGENIKVRRFVRFTLGEKV